MYFATEEMWHLPKHLSILVRYFNKQKNGKNTKKKKKKKKDNDEYAKNVTL